VTELNVRIVELEGPDRPGRPIGSRT